LSRGCGYLQRRLLRLVEKAERRGDVLTRRDLEDRLCAEGYRSDNVLRAIRGLARAGKVRYVERRFASNCLIRPPRTFIPFTDEQIFEMLEEPGWSTGVTPDAAKKTTRVSEENPQPRVEVGLKR